MFLALQIEREVDHHDAVLLHDADQQDDADDRDDIQIETKEHEREQSAEAGRGQCREDRDRMHEALVEDPEHDVHGDDGGQHEQALVRQRTLEGGRGALVVGDNARRQCRLRDHLVDRGERLAERVARGEVEGNRDGRELALVIDRERLSYLLDAGERAERNGIGMGGGCRLIAGGGCGTAGADASGDSVDRRSQHRRRRRIRDRGGSGI